MKKKLLILLALTSLFFMTGCTWWDKATDEMTDTPTQKVEEYLKKYQNMDSEIENNIKDFFFYDDITDENSEEYKEIVKNNYKKMTYDIKDEEIDGKSATVKVEIEVVSYVAVLDEIDKHMKDNEKDFLTDDEIDNELVNNYRLEKLKAAKDTETYIVEFSLNKEDDEWKLNNPTKEIQDKINGLYK